MFDFELTLVVIVICYNFMLCRIVLGKGGYAWDGHHTKPWPAPMNSSYKVVNWRWPYFIIYSARQPSRLIYQEILRSTWTLILSVLWLNSAVDTWQQHLLFAATLHVMLNKNTDSVFHQWLIHYNIYFYAFQQSLNNFDIRVSYQIQYIFTMQLCYTTTCFYVSYILVQNNIYSDILANSWLTC